MVKRYAAENIAAIAWWIESFGLLETAEKFSDNVYDFLFQMADKRKSYPFCKDPKRAIMGYKCILYKKKYTIVFVETSTELIICEFISSKRIYW